MDLGGEALGSYKARQGGCTQIQVSDIDGRLSQVFLNFSLPVQFFNESDNLKCVFPPRTDEANIAI
jgi:hypothetical protein